MALKEEFKAYVPELVPLLLPVLHKDRSGAFLDEDAGLQLTPLFAI